MLRKSGDYSMQTISATNLARRTREVLDKVVTQGATIIVERNDRVIARIAPEVSHMTASAALAGLGERLSPAEADSWLKDIRGDFDESLRDPWA
jgi:antitoxin (DNA-binding transcriptional repressor) of toxin-antitoxin stability system